MFMQMQEQLNKQAETIFPAAIGRGSSTKR
jgi:hypothetical protein